MNIFVPPVKKVHEHLECFFVRSSSKLNCKLIAHKRVPSLYNIFVHHLLPLVIPLHTRIHIFSYVDVELRPCVFCYCMRQINGWCGPDFICRMHKYSGSSWGIPGCSNCWDKLPILKKTHLFHHSSSHQCFYDHQFQYPAYKPLLHPTNIKYSLPLKNLDYEHHSPPKQTSYKCSTKKKQKM